MKLNFDISKLATAKDKFIWSTILYILNILDRLKKLPNDEIDNTAFLIDVLKMDIMALNNSFYIYDRDLLNLIDFDLINYEKKFIEFIKHVPVNIHDYDMLA